MISFKAYTKKKANNEPVVSSTSMSDTANITTAQQTWVGS